MTNKAGVAQIILTRIPAPTPERPAPTRGPQYPAEKNSVTGDGRSTPGAFWPSPLWRRQLKTHFPSHVDAPDPEVERTSPGRHGAAGCGILVRQRAGPGSA